MTVYFATTFNSWNRESRKHEFDDYELKDTKSITAEQAIKKHDKSHDALQMKNVIGEHCKCVVVTWEESDALPASL